MTDTLHALIAQLHHPDRNLRGRTALSLGDCREPEALDALLDALGTESDLFVREDITWALVRCGDAAVEPLIDLLKHHDAGVRHHVAHALGKIRDVRAINPLISALADESDSVILKAAFSLGQMNATSAIPALMALLGHPNAEVRTTLVKVLEGFGDAAAPSLLAALHHPVWQVREQAVDILGQIGDRKSLPAVLTLLTDERWEVRFSAVNAVGHLGSKATITTTLTAVLNDSDSRIASLATEILARLKTTRKPKMPSI